MSSHDSKKRKRNVVLHQDPADTGPNTTKPSAIFKPTKGRTHTLSIALPGSIIANAQTHDLQTYLASTIARAAAVFAVSEIVIFGDGTTGPPPTPPSSHKHTGFSNPSHFLASVLAYLETPPHLRRALMPFHQNFRFVGNAPSLDMPHHMRAGEWCRYREGVALEPGTSTSTTTKRRKGENKGGGTLVECGLPVPVEVPVEIPANTRVTLKFAHDAAPPDLSNPGPAEAVSPDAPAEEGGYYWGYSVRQAASLSAVFTEAPWKNGYDVSIGTSERGVPVEEVLPVSHNDNNKKENEEGEKRLPKFKHLLLVFGGVAGLEVAANADAELGERGITGRNVSELFDAWVNLVPGQGSRTIRCEEAVWIGLAGIRGYVSGWGV